MLLKKKAQNRRNHIHVSTPTTHGYDISLFQSQQNRWQPCISTYQSCEFVTQFPVFFSETEVNTCEVPSLCLCSYFVIFCINFTTSLMAREVTENCTVLEDLSTPLEAVISLITKDQNSSILRCKVPDLCKSEDCVVGIDEAGRGPVLGIYHFTLASL